MLRRYGLVAFLLLVAATLRAQQVILDPARSSQPVTKLASDVLRWTAHYAGDDVFGLHQWRIVVMFEPLEGGVSARTSFNLVYRIAHVSYDLTKLVREDEPWRTVLHETLHLRLAELTAVVMSLAAGNPSAEQAILNAIEATVTDISMATIWKRP